MAVGINTVYQTVLYVLNKEQRGYVTPAEFNRLAQLVQNEIFQSYFPDGNQLNRQNQNNTQNDTEFFNIFENNRYKLYPFEREVDFVYDSDENTWSVSFTESDQIYLMGNIISSYSGQPAFDSITELTSKSNYDKITRSNLTSPTKKYPLAYQFGTSNQASSAFLTINPNPSSVRVNCIFAPTTPVWAFNTLGAGTYAFNASSSNNFQLDISEEFNIVIGILKYAGVIINDPTVIEVAAQEAQQVEANEKS
tara:strand:+ start:602 stop:1354 length:753 start_codon:yes stop_codon:yes gene_type:complete